MEKDKIIKLTNALYKVTDLFPANETLGVSIRKKGNSVLSFLIILNDKDLILSSKELKEFSLKCRRNIEILLSYFEIAETQNWVNPRNFEILKSQYMEVLKKLKEIKIIEKKESKKTEKKVDKEEKVEEKKEKQTFTLTEIQEKVVNLLQGNGKMKPSDINDFFPSLNPRSIRRELRDLKERGIVTSNGSGKRTFYEMNSYY